jgi:hypothetical protein
MLTAIIAGLRAQIIPSAKGDSLFAQWRREMRSLFGAIIQGKATCKFVFVCALVLLSLASPSFGSNPTQTTKALQVATDTFTDHSSVTSQVTQASINPSAGSSILPQIVENLDTLVILSARDITTMRTAIDLITLNGGCIVHIFPPHVLIGNIPVTADANLIGHAGIQEIHRTPLDPAHVSQYGSIAITGVIAWNSTISRKDQPTTPQPPSPLPVLKDTTFTAPPLIPAPRREETTTGLSDPNRTSDYLIGRIGVGIVFPESNGNAENWTQARRDQVISQIKIATEWWAARELRANLSFVYDIYFSVPTSYEPIQLKGGPPWQDGQEHLWISEVLTAMGYSGSDHMTQVRSYVNRLVAE